MNTSSLGLSSEFWKSYWNILYFFGQPGQGSDVAFIMTIILGTALLIVGTLAFLTWQSYVENEKNQYSGYAQSQDFPGTPGASPPPAILYQRPELGDWYELEASEVAQDEIQRSATGTSILSTLLDPEFLTSKESNLTPPPPYELDCSCEDIPPV